MVKRMLATLMLFVLCLPLTALADVAEQVQAPAQITDTWTSATGKTVIHVHAPIHVPDAQAMYLIPVTAAVFEDEMALRLAELMWPGIDEPLEITDDENGYYLHHSATVFRRGTPQEDIRIETHAVHDLLKRPEGIVGNTLSGSIIRGMDAGLAPTVSYYDPYMTTEVDGEGLPGHQLTRAQAAAEAELFLRTLTDEPFELFAVGQNAGLAFNSKSPTTAAAPSYTFAFTRRLDGVPLLPCMHGFMSASNRDDLLTPPVSYEEILMSMDREGRITGFLWHAPYVYGDDRAPQALLPFETVLDVAHRTLPLKYQGWEAYGDVSYELYRIDLGYMALLQKDRSAFALTPVWNFYGHLTTEDEEGTIGCLPILTVHAVDGSVIDLDLGY